MGKKLKKNWKNWLWNSDIVTFWQLSTTSILFTNYNNCLWMCWFLPKNQSNFVSLLFETWQPIPVSVRDSIQLGSLSYRKLALKIDPVIFRKARLFHNFKGLKLTKVVSELVKIIWTVRIHSRLQPPRSPEANIMFSKVDIRFVIMRQLRRFWKIKQNV